MRHVFVEEHRDACDSSQLSCRQGVIIPSAGDQHFRLVSSLKFLLPISDVMFDQWCTRIVVTIHIPEPRSCSSFARKCDKLQNIVSALNVFDFYSVSTVPHFLSEGEFGTYTPVTTFTMPARDINIAVL